MMIYLIMFFKHRLFSDKNVEKMFYIFFSMNKSFYKNNDNCYKIKLSSCSNVKLCSIEFA